MKLTPRRALGTVVAASALTAGGVATQRGCSPQDCAKLLQAVEAACQAEPLGVTCVRLRAQWQKSCAVVPTPSPEPTATPTAPPTPAPTPTPTAEPTPAPTPTPVPASACPKALAPGAIVYLNDKPYGQGFDSTVRVQGDPEFCRLIHGVAINDCHLEGLPKRVKCEMELIHGCPVWQFTVDGGSSAHPCVDDQDVAPFSCDHFGNVEFRDDPKTPTTGDTLATLRGFEGQPLECGFQRDIHGPMAGFFTVAHGKGQIRACKPDGKGCGPWRGVDH